MLAKLKTILSAWWLVLIGWDSDKAKKRRMICTACDYRKFFVCGECGCPIIAKSRSEEDCPKGFWL